MVKNQEVIITDIERAGSGAAVTSPIRVITSVWAKDGALIATNDPLTFTIEQVADALYVMQHDNIIGAQNHPHDLLIKYFKSPE